MSANAAEHDGVQAEVLAFLRGTGAWPGRPDAVATVETHGAVVFLAGDEALKIKRAVKLPYLDFSTLDARRRFSERELQLNRPHAPDIYLGVVPVTREVDGRLAIGGRGRPVEWAVRMRRFDEADLLSRSVARHGMTPQIAAALAGMVARYHASAPRGVPAANGLEAVAGSISSSLEASGDRRIVAKRAELGARIAAALSATGEIRRERAEAGCVRRCHGDLHLNNIVLWQGRPVPFDCIEFDEALATIDTLYDLAFLIMDLERNGARAAANAVLSLYLWLTGSDIDVRGLAALPLYLGLRAGVRAMVALDRAHVTAATAELLDHVADTLDLANRCLAPPPPRLVAVGGLSGTGKTVLASALAPLFGAVPGALHLRSDLERKRLAGVGELDRLPEHAYTQGSAARVYACLAERAGLALRAGHSVVVDAVYALRPERDEIERVARDSGARFAGIWLETSADVLKARVEARVNDASDATPAVVDLQARLDTGSIAWRRIDAGRPAPAVLADALPALGPARI